MISNGNRTEWSPIRSVIIRVACEQALRSRMGRKERGKKKEGVGRGKKAGRDGEVLVKQGTKIKSARMRSTRTFVIGLLDTLLLDTFLLETSAARAPIW